MNEFRSPHCLFILQRMCPSFVMEQRGNGYENGIIGMNDEGFLSLKKYLSLIQSADGQGKLEGQNDPTFFVLK